MVEDSTEIIIDSSKRVNGPSFGGLLLVDNEGVDEVTTKSHRYVH